MNTDIGGAGAAGANRVQQLQSAVGPIDGEGADGALLVVADAIGFIGGVEAGSCRVQRQATRARAHLDDADRRHGAGDAIHVEEMDAAAISRRQIHLRRQGVAERRAERAHVPDQWPGGLACFCPGEKSRQRGDPREGNCCFQKRATQKS